jgi:acyl-CoA thioester hydrolase
MEYETKFRVYYEDTDSGGVVYHATYLNFAERARTELLRNIGIEQSTLLEKEGILFVVSEINIKYIKPAKLDDTLLIITKIIHKTKIKLEILQEIYVEDKMMAKLNVKVICVDNAIKISKIPEHIFCKL